ncbi:MAG: hypothetical protein ACKOX6_01415 [Bdellovibrio sp.]
MENELMQLCSRPQRFASSLITLFIIVAWSMSSLASPPVSYTTQKALFSSLISQLPKNDKAREIKLFRLRVAEILSGKPEYETSTSRQPLDSTNVADAIDLFFYLKTALKDQRKFQKNEFVEIRRLAQAIGAKPPDVLLILGWIDAKENQKDAAAKNLEAALRYYIDHFEKDETRFGCNDLELREKSIFVHKLLVPLIDAKKKDELDRLMKPVEESKVKSIAC